MNTTIFWPWIISICVVIAVLSAAYCAGKRSGERKRTVDSLVDNERGSFLVTTFDREGRICKQYKRINILTFEEMYGGRCELKTLFGDREFLSKPDLWKISRIVISRRLEEIG